LAEERKGRSTTHNTIGQTIVKQAILIIVTLIAIYPLFWMIITAFKTQGDYLVNKFGLPWPLALENFMTALRGGRFARWFFNSIVITTGSTGAVLVITSLAAFTFAKMPFRGSNTYLNLVISLMVIPPVVMIVPLFILYAQLDMTSTYQGIIIHSPTSLKPCPGILSRRR